MNVENRCICWERVEKAIEVVQLEASGAPRVWDAIVSLAHENSHLRACLEHLEAKIVEHVEGPK